MRRRIILIAGPTASGKSAVALALAERLGATIVNADSMQVYAGLRVLTAQPTQAEQARAPHRLYGHIDPAEAYSVARWLAEVETVVRSDGVPLIFVGGTGLYFEALTHGLAMVPPVSAAVREAVRTAAEGRQTAELHAHLAQRDPAGAARLRPSDRQRILRALEVLAATGRPLAAWQAGRAVPLVPPEQATRVVLAVERATLHHRIATRFAFMLDEGGLDEVAALAARRLSPMLPAMKALGVRPLLGYLRNETTRDEAAAMIVRDTRRYAKRQETWFRNRMADWPRVAPEGALAAALAPTAC